VLRRLYFELFVALRYLRGAQGREEGRRFIRFVTYIAIGGVTVGVAALLLALSIVHGFSREIEAKITGFGAHIQVENLRDAPLSDASWMEAALQHMPGVVSVRPVIQEFVLIRRSRREVDGVALWGSPRLPEYLQQHLVAGTAQFTPDSLGRPGLIVGRQLAEQLGLRVGDPVTLFSMRHLPSSARPRVRVRQFYVAGLYETLLADFDRLYVFTSLDAARTLLEYGPDEVTRFDLTLQNVQDAPHLARQIEDHFGLPVIARTIYEVFRNLFAWVRLQESIIPLVISIIVIVAAFNMLATLLMVILEKAREIGILASMGASRRRLQRTVPDPRTADRTGGNRPGRTPGAQPGPPATAVRAHSAARRGLLHANGTDCAADRRFYSGCCRDGGALRTGLADTGPHCRPDASDSGDSFSLSRP